jgi:hypothetical protein
MLTSKSADGTPITVVARTRHVLPSGQSVLRSGRTCEEYLVKNQFIRVVLSTGECCTRVLLQDPVALSHGKKADNIFQACSKDWKSLRQLGHRGCAVEHYAFDRCCYTAHERTWRQWHAMSAGDFDQLSPGLPAEVFRLTEFLVFTPCAAHDCANALKWSLACRFENKDLLRDAYIVVESLRNSWSTLSSHLCEWIALRVTFSDELTMEQQELWRMVWTSLSVEPETVEVLATLLQFRFEGGRIHVSQRSQEEVDVVPTICAALLSTWRFTKWTESRFCSVGVSSRALVAGLLTGLEDLVAFIIEKGSASLYYLNGFNRLRGELKTFMVECAMVSRLTEGALLSLMEDPRVCRTYQELWRTVSEEMLWLTQLPMTLWTVLASSTATDCTSLRSSCISAAHTSKHFFWRRVLQPAGQRPWSLARGDLQKNLHGLRAETEAPEEPMTLQLWLLLQAGFPMSQLVCTLELLQDVGWTTLPVEQQHGSLASLRRLHPEYGSDTLSARATVMMLRRLLPKPSAQEKQLNVLSKKIGQLLRKQPEKAGARQELLSQLFAVFRDRTWLDRPKPAGIEKRLMANHHSMWAEASIQQRLLWGKQALARSEQRRAALTAEVDALRAAKDLLSSRMGSEEEPRLPLVMSEAALSQKDLDVFDHLWQSKQFSGQSLEKLRDSSRHVPAMTPFAVSRRLQAQAVYELDHPSMPQWVAAIAHHREFFVDTALVCFDKEDNASFWKVLYAIITPLYLALSELRVLEEVVSIEPGSRWDLAVRHPSYAFHCNFAAHRSGADLPGVEEDVAISVLPGLQHLNRTRVVSFEDLVPLDTFLASLPEPPPSAGTSKKARTASSSKSFQDEDVFQLPWLAEVDLKEGFSAKEGSPAGLSSASSHSKATEVVMEEELFEQALKALAVARMALHEEEPASADDFRTRVLGGAWLLKHKGIPFDAIQGYARTELAKDFCTKGGLQKTMRFDHTLYGGPACGILARGWCHKMQWLFNNYLDSSVPAKAAAAAIAASEYPEESEFSTMASDAAGKLAVRVRQIRDMV